MSGRLSDTRLSLNLLYLNNILDCAKHAPASTIYIISYIGRQSSDSGEQYYTCVMIAHIQHRSNVGGSIFATLTTIRASNLFMFIVWMSHSSFI